MADKINFMELLFKIVQGYAKTSYELLKLKVLHKVTKIISLLISSIVVVIFLSMFIILLNIGVALWLGDLLGKSYYGFFCVAGLYGIIGSVVYFCTQHQIQKWVGKAIISKTLD